MLGMQSLNNRITSSTKREVMDIIIVNSFLGYIFRECFSSWNNIWHQDSCFHIKSSTFVRNSVSMPSGACFQFRSKKAATKTLDIPRRDIKTKASKGTSKGTSKRTSKAVYRIVFREVIPLFLEVSLFSINLSVSGDFSQKFQTRKEDCVSENNGTFDSKGNLSGGLLFSWSDSWILEASSSSSSSKAIQEKAILFNSTSKCQRQTFSGDRLSILRVSMTLKAFQVHFCFTRSNIHLIFQLKTHPNLEPSLHLMMLPSSWVFQGFKTNLSKTIAWYDCHVTQDKLFLFIALSPLSWVTINL